MMQLLTRVRSGLAALQWRDFALAHASCPFCGPSIFVRINRDETGVRCLRCAASAVHIAMGWALLAQQLDLAATDACEFSARGPLVAYLHRHARSLALSEYFADLPSGALRNDVRCEDMQRLSYADASFDLITHTEVLEHVPDDALALAELYRVLRPGGHLLFTVPMFDGEHTIERAYLRDGVVEHLQPPVYHRDPLRGGEGILAFRDYGRDILIRLQAAGFVASQLFIARQGIPWIVARQVVIAKKNESVARNLVRGKQAMARQKILIDTDPGVDDALAILMAHAYADVVALSIAAGNVGLSHTVANALKLVEVIGATTPVFAGCESPLVLPAEDAAFVHGLDGFGDTNYRAASAHASAEHAALAILRLSHEYAGELMLVAMAPLTNIALALKLDPSLPTRIARLVIMGGAVTGRGNTRLIPAEFNISFDPEAAHIVFSNWPQFTLVDWEATMAQGVDFSRWEKLLSGTDQRAVFYRSIAQKTLLFTQGEGRESMFTADALAMAVALDPEIVTHVESRHVAIELQGALTRGATVVDWDQRSGKSANAQIVLGVDQARFETMLAQALGSK